MLVNKPIK